MPLYLGAYQAKVYLDKTLYNINKQITILTKGILLKSSNNYILKDKNGIYLTAKEAK